MAIKLFAYIMIATAICSGGMLFFILANNASKKTISRALKAAGGVIMLGMWCYIISELIMFFYDLNIWWG